MMVLFYFLDVSNYNLGFGIAVNEEDEFEESEEEDTEEEDWNLHWRQQDIRIISKIWCYGTKK